MEAVNDDKKAFIAKARQAKKNGDETFMFAGKEYPCTVKSEASPDMGSMDGKKKLKKDLKARHCNSEDASNNKSDDGEGLDKADPKAAKKKFADRKYKDIDNDGDTDDSDEYLHKKLGTVAKKTESTKPKRLSDIKSAVVGIPALGDFVKGK